MRADLPPRPTGEHARAPRLSAEGSCLLSDIIPSRERPRVLYEAFRAGRVSVTDLPQLIAFVWLYDDSPTSALSEAEWLEMYNATGFFSHPGEHHRPVSPVTLYRGTSASRVHRMSWTGSRDLAAVLGRRHTRDGTPALYQATVAPDAILAFLCRPDEGWTVVVHPSGLANVGLVGEI